MATNKITPTVRRRCEYCHELPHSLPVVRERQKTGMLSSKIVFYVECPTCKARGPQCATPVEAAWAWNAPDKPTTDKTRWWPGKRP